MFSTVAEYWLCQLNLELSQGITADILLMDMQQKNSVASNK